MDTFTTESVITGLVVAETVGLTALHLHARQLLQRLRTDELTGLGNRAALIRAYRRLRPRSGLVGVLLLDLDGFKQVNDRHGHRTGDHLLRAVAAHLAAACLVGEVAVRLHGDEFAVLLGPTGPARATARRDAITAALASTYRIDGLTVRATASVGVAVAPHSAGLGELLRQADLDMYAAKRVRHVVVGGHPRAGVA